MRKGGTTTELRWWWDSDADPEFHDLPAWPSDYQNPLDYYQEVPKRRRFHGWWYGLADLLIVAAIIWLLSR